MHKIEASTDQESESKGHTSLVKVQIKKAKVEVTQEKVQIKKKKVKVTQEQVEIQDDAGRRKDKLLGGDCLLLEPWVCRQAYRSCPQLPVNQLLISCSFASFK